MVEEVEDVAYPACVYGFFTYLIVAGTAVAGLVSGRRSRSRRDAVGGTVGVTSRPSEART
jgi:hypothetical protein